MAKLTPSRSFKRYVVAGIYTFLTEYLSFYILFVFVGINLTVANVLSFLLALGVNFLINQKWTFKHKTYLYSSRTTHQFAYYCVLVFANLGLTILLVNGLTDIGVDPRLSKLIAMLLTSLWNFFIFKKAIFRHLPAE